MVKLLKKTTFKEFFKVNEYVAHTTPMRTHYHSKNPLEKWIWQKKKEVIKKLISNTGIKNIIDLGCGDGGMIDAVKKDIAYTGIDISPTQVFAAKEYMKKQRKQNAKIKEGDVTLLKEKTSSYDAALACDIVEHVLSPKKLFSEMKRIVKKNGYIFLSIPNEYLWEFFRAALLRFPLRSPDHIHAIEQKDIEENFPVIEKREFLPIPMSSKLSLIHIYVIRNKK